ncbi:MAG: antibiotic biosynthesis monooxygenase, partial [Halofilum sp. (in: g-proteobacteria)]
DGILQCVLARYPLMSACATVESDEEVRPGFRLPPPSGLHPHPHIACEFPMHDIASTPEPPYYAVIFTSLRTEGDDGYAAMSERMIELAATQEGFLGVESAREGVGITVSYWRSLEAIREWKANSEHREAQRLGREHWYAQFRVRITKVEREYGN